MRRLANLAGTALVVCTLLTAPSSVQAADPVITIKRTDRDMAAARYVVNRDPVAYAHAVREAKILAARGTAGHPLGCAPGCRRSGTGYSYSARPNHCFYGEVSDRYLVARACVRGRNGAYYWSAHYR